MKLSIKKGFSFGLTSGIITTLGLMVGLDSSTKSSLVVIGGIIVIAIADACSDALGIHVSEESENKHTTKEIWESTIVTFFSKFIFASIFVIPVILLPLKTAILISIITGLSLITIFSFILAKGENMKASSVIFEHLFIAIIVIIVTHYVGDFVATFK